MGTPSTPRLKAAVLVDDMHLTGWQYDALLRVVADTAQVSVILLCENSRVKHSLRHAAYYALSLAAFGSSRTHFRDMRALCTRDTQVIRFSSEWTGIWQRLPLAVLDTLRKAQIDVVIKFGMGLMKDADAVPAPLGVLSYHHGDPSRYRGRPACFYEVLAGDQVQGVMVQRISNRLDSGAVLAYGDYWIRPDSLRRTRDHVYQASTSLLRLALRNAAQEIVLTKRTDGVNYRLPNTSQVFALLGRTTARKARRLTYGLTVQKRWRVAFGGSIPSFETDTALRPEGVLAGPEGTAFLADPHVVDDQTLLCEGLSSNTGRGQVLQFTAGVSQPVRGLPSSHLSYPSVVRHEGRAWLLPEMQRAGPQLIYPLDLETATVAAGLRMIGLEDRRLVDPTLFEHEGMWWLFAGESGTAQDCLSLFWSHGMFGPYHPHPSNPIVAEPSRARMAGSIINHQGHLYRPGQDSSKGYGAGLTFCRIDQLSSESYAETPIGSLSMRSAKGPHTINVSGRGTVFDYYTEERTLRAGWTRVRGLVSRRST